MSDVSKEIAIELVEDGQAGNGIVSVTRTYGISASGTTASDTTSPSDITTWSAGSPTVTTAKPYLWVKEITVYTEIPDATKYYCVGKRGDNGIDAKDVEWAYIRTKTPTPPIILNDSTYTDSNSKTYTADGHLPRVDSTNRTDIEKENSGSSSKYYECTDDPKGVNDTWKYEWEIKRTKGSAGADGSRAWNYYTGTMTLHNNYAESAFIIDIDNDNDQFGTDSDSKVLVEQTRSTKVTLYDGATEQTLKSLTVALKYENGTTNVPIDVATYTADKDTGKVDVTVKVNNTPNSHTEIQAHITATDTNDRQKTIVFALYKVMGGAPGLTPIIYNIAATDKVFSFQRTDANALTPSSRTSQINVARTEGNTTTILDQPQTGLTFSWGFDEETTAQATGQSIGDSIEVTNTQATSHSSVWVELSKGDRETLAIVKDGAKGNSGTSVEAQYAPNSSPTSSQIHTTFQNGDKYMRTRSGSGSWSNWQKIVGENGAETDFTFNISKNKTSTNASTAPANCYYSEWQDAPIAVTTTYPYLWAKVVQKDGGGTTQSTRYIRLTGEDGKSVLAQYSVDGSSNWHSTFATGDEWMRTSDNGGTSWSTAMKIVGEDGNSTNFEFGISQYQTATGAPSDISTWSDAPIATTSSKPYLWSKVTTPDGTVSYIRLTGEKGASITKSSEVSTYKVSDSGTTTPTGTWYSTKAAANNAYAWSANRYMWTKTVITWSDTSTTTLYSAERNPDDGDAGMSIVIASQSVTYSKQTSGNLDPTTLTYGSYPSSLSKGDWLYSKTTVNYETSEGASAESTSTYSVSYIGTDGVGQAGRGITGVYEHYKASSNSIGETTPTSTDWGTTPTPSDWGKDKPYLWNYERITYSSGTTVERTTAGVVAVWTEDGAGIDSITNYYLATSASSGVTTSTSGWTPSVQNMDETNCYLWNYECISYTQGKSSTTTTPHIIGHYGKNGTSPIVADIDNEMDAVSVDKLGYVPNNSTTEGSITYAAKVQTTAKLLEGSSPKSFTMKVYDENGTEYTNNGSYRNGIKVVYTSGSQTSNLVKVYFQSGANVGDKKVFTITLDSTYSVQFTVKGVQGDIYQLLPNIDEVVFGVDSTTNQWTPPSIGVYCGYTKNVGGTITEYVGTDRANTCKSNASYTEDGTTKYGTAPYNIFFRYQNADSTWGSWSWNKDKTNGTIPIANNTTYVAIQFVLSSATGTGSITEDKIIDKETLPITKAGKKGDDGTSPIIVDLDNDSDQFGTDSNGLTLSAQNKATGVKLYYGTTLQTITKLVATVYRASATSTSIGSATATTSGTEVSSNVTISSTKVATIKSLFSGTSGTITFGIVNNVTINDDFIIKIEAFRSSSESRTVNFTLKQVKSGAAGVAPDLCNLRPTLSKVSFTKSELSGSTAKKLGCGYTLVTPSGTTNTAIASSVSVNGTTYYIWWRYVGGTYAKFTTSSAIYSTGILPSTTQTGVEFVLSNASSASNIAAANTLDYENVPIIKDGTDGTSPYIADLDNEMDSVLLTYDGKVDGTQAVETNVSMFHGVTPITPNTIEVYDGTESSSNKYTSGTPKGGITVTISGQKITASFANNTDLSSYGKKVFLIKLIDSTDDVTRYLNFTVHLVWGAADGTPATIYNILPSLTEVSVGRNDDNSFAPRYNTLQCGYKKSIGSDITTVTEATGNIDGTYRLFFRRRNRSNQTWESTYYYYNDSTYKRYIVVTSGYSTSGLDVETYDAVEFYIYKNTSSDSLTSLTSANIADKETVSVISDGENGAKGENSIRLALDNEHEDFIYSGSGKVAPSSVLRITPTLYDGLTPIASENVGWQIDTSKSSGTEIKNSGNPTTYPYTGDCAYIGPLGELDVNGLTANTAKIVVKAKYPNDNTGQYYYATFSANKTQQDKYDLVFSDNAIAYNPATYTSQTQKRIKVYADVTNLSGATSRATISTSTSTPSAGTLRLYATYGGNTVQITNTVTENSITKHYLDVTPAIAAANDGIYFELRRYTDSSAYDVVDHETVEIAKVQNGNNGDGGLSIAITPSTLVVNTDSNGVTEAASQDFTFKVYKGKDEVPTAEYNVTHSSLPNNNWTWTGLYYNAFRIQCASGATFTTPTAITVTVALSSGGSIQTSVLLVPNRKGANGKDAIHIDLDNEVDALQYMGGVKLTDSVQSQATLYGATGTITLHNSTTIGEDYCSISNGLVTVTDLRDSDGNPLLSGVVVVTASVNGTAYYATFTVQRLDNGEPKYEIYTNPSVMIGNVDASSASATVAVQVYRTAIDTNTNMLTRSLVENLSTYGLKLWRKSNTASTPTDYTSTYNSGGSGWNMTVNVKGLASNVTDYTLYVAKSTVSAANVATNSIDKETLPVVRVYNGQQGIQGKMGRTPYYWGKWSDKESTDTFTVNDYMTPYVANGETGGIPQCWIFVGANGSYTKSTADEPSNSSTNWQLMTSDFEYLITKAIFSDFAQLGSGIFNGDYMYSQYGTYDGTANDNHYERFTPQVFQDTIVLKSETTTTTTINQSETTIGTSYLVKGAYYKIIIGLSNVTSSTRIYLNGYVNGSSTASPAWNEAVSSSSTSFVRKTVTSDGGGYWKDSGNVTWKVRVAAGTANVTYAIIEHIDFNPNLSIDWLNGIIRANTGWFKNVTVEGVMNNLIQEITSENYTDYGVYTSGTNADAFWLNTAKVGSIIRYKYTKPLGLPSAYANAGTPVETYLCDSGDGTHQMTLNELRQCIGKKIYVLTDENTGMARIRVGKWFSALDQEKMLLYNNTWYYDFSSNTTLADWFWVFECKMGERNGRECIYWELLASHNKLPDNLAF